MLPDFIPNLGLEISRRLEPPREESTTRSIGRLVAAVAIFAAGAGCVWLSL